MLLVFQIAAGIVLAVVVLVYHRQIIKAAFAACLMLSAIAISGYAYSVIGEYSETIVSMLFTLAAFLALFAILKFFAYADLEIEDRTGVPIGTVFSIVFFAVIGIASVILWR